MLKDLLFPKRCFACRGWGSYICKDCEVWLPIPLHQRCIICQKASLGGWTHPHCRTKTSPDRLVTVYDYHAQITSQLLNTAKLALVPEIFIELASSACAKIEFRQPGWDEFVLCPIPQTRAKTRWRGFNQSDLICLAVSARFGLSVDRVLAKSRRTKQQKELNKVARQTNLTNSFRICSPEYVPKKVILVDDISTTGSTFREAAKVLKSGGAELVWCLALAQD